MDDKDFEHGMTVGSIIMGVFTIIILINIYSCDSLRPYVQDATQVDLVKRGHAHWETLEDGETVFHLDSIKGK